MLRRGLRLSVVAMLVCGVGLLLSWRGSRSSTATAADADAKAAAKPATANATKLDHPFVAGFDRFHTDDNSDGISGGLLLLGELGCTACHAAEGLSATHINAKQAPLLGFVATRADPRILMRFIADPHGTKPGTTMPSVLSAIGSAEAQSTAEAITHYLASLPASLWRATGTEMTAVVRGEELFHTVGCVACHAPRRAAKQPAGTSAASATEDSEAEDRPAVDLNLASVPLSTKLHEKYSITSLATFLIDPLKVRPSGRMPRLNLSATEASDIANYLLKDTPAPSNLRVSYYEGSWRKLPDFDRLTPKSTGGASDFSLGPLRKKTNFAVKFDGYLRIETDGEYQFHLESDDGSQLFIDRRLVVDNDEIHGVEHATGKVQLRAGLHPIRVTFFQEGGEAALAVSYEGPGIRRTRIPPLLLSAEEKPRPGDEPFVVDSSLAERGREQFVSIGCANCHQLGEPHSAVASMLELPPVLANCRTDQGCLSNAPASGRPHYSLNQRQRISLVAAIRAIQNQQLPPRTPQGIIAATMTTFNCYACHKRDRNWRRDSRARRILHRQPARPG